MAVLATKYALMRGGYIGECFVAARFCKRLSGKTRGQCQKSLEPSWHLVLWYN